MATIQSMDRELLPPTFTTAIARLTSAFWVSDGWAYPSGSAIVWVEPDVIGFDVVARRGERRLLSGGVRL